MKDDKQLVALAMKMASEDANTVIMFALPSYPEARAMFEIAKEDASRDTATFKHQTITVEFESGGKVTFRAITEESANDWGGYQYTHAFVPRNIGPRCLAVVKHKVRHSVSRPPKVESGIFLPHWIERWTYEAYDAT